MEAVKFSWDTRKAKQNLTKHKVSFEEASAAFFDVNARLMHDPDHSKSEDRFVLIGLGASLGILVVCHCYRTKGQEIRIISARKANRIERKQYRSFL